jgi:CDP-diacylglycerol--glycerol-3-phosphate 3-phosphatidyltransferase
LPLEGKYGDIWLTTAVGGGTKDSWTPPERDGNLRITANQLTVSRIVLMPIPVALALTNDRWLQLLAWVLYVILGVTDYFDGMLARKYGFTRFGRLTDPIADKIYVALVFLPLALLALMPAWMVILVLMRDPVITAMRSMSERYGITMKTATLAKYKTAIQMIAGGYILFVGVVPERGWTLASMALMASLAWFFYVLKRFLRRSWDPRLLTMGGLMTFGLLVRVIFNIRITLLVYSFLILGVTWVSAWKYAIDLVIGIRKSSKSVGAIWWLFYGLESTAVPIFVLLMVFHGSVPVWIPMTVFCTELAVGALDNMLTQEGIGRTPRHMGIKFGLQALIAVGFVAVSVLPELSVVAGVGSHLVLAAAFGAVTLVTTMVAFGRYAPRIL